MDVKLLDTWYTSMSIQVLLTNRTVTAVNTSTVSQHDSVARYSRDFVKHIFLGRGVFTSANTIEVAGKTLKFDKVSYNSCTRRSPWLTVSVLSIIMGKMLKSSCRGFGIMSSFYIMPCHVMLCHIMF